MYNNNTGNVGIGTSSPTTLLHVAGTIASTNSTGVPSNIPLITMQYNSTLDRGEILSVNNSVAWKPLVLTRHTLSFVSYGTNQGLFQDASGNVGIGTITIPSAYKLAINGAAIGTSMKVKFIIAGLTSYLSQITISQHYPR